VIGMAKRGRVKITVVEPRFFRFSATGIEEDLVNTCPLENILGELDDSAARMKARINAWSVGDVSRLKELTLSSSRSGPLQGSKCMATVEGSAVWLRNRQAVARHVNKWVGAAERALATNAITLAVLDVSELFSESGVLEALRGRGYEVVEP
jgi:hypothetical protein